MFRPSERTRTETTVHVELPVGERDRSRHSYALPVLPTPCGHSQVTGDCAFCRWFRLTDFR